MTDFSNYMKGFKSPDEMNPGDAIDHQITQQQLENGVFNVQHILGELVQGKWLKLYGAVDKSTSLLGMGEDGSVGYVWIGQKVDFATGKTEYIIRIPNSMRIEELVRKVCHFNLVEIERMVNDGEEVRRNQAGLE